MRGSGRWTGPVWRRALAAGLALGLSCAGAVSANADSGAATSPGSPVDLSAAERVKAWILDKADNQGLPYLVIDKINAEVSAFAGDGRLLGTAPVLLGLARGDVSPPGIGDRPLSAILPDERITPAGRFVASMGENLSGKGILWIDYDAALSLHPVITTRPADRRLERLATVTVDDNRISFGCINVPAKFYADIVQPAFQGTTGVVYILPEDGSLEDVLFSTRPQDEASP